MQQESRPQENGAAPVLRPGAELLRGQYVIERHLLSGGFGITYLARDSLERRVVIKECYPEAICCRAGVRVQARTDDSTGQYVSILRHFLREARRMARLSHPNIVGVHQVFEENGTAYMALDHVQGIDLLRVVRDTPERLTPALLREMLETALAALRHIHDRGILHGDISPNNFLLGADNRLTLIDFGAARKHAGRENRVLSALLAVKDGYSPHEFYLSDATQSPSSDLYSLGATFYHLITGAPPPHSHDRLAAIAAHGPDPCLPLTGRMPAHAAAFLRSIDMALAVLPRDRIQTAQDWLAALGTAPAGPVRLEPELQQTISRLVEDTNRDLRPRLPDDATAQRQVEGTIRFRPVIDEPKRGILRHPVDIFGNPIADVDSWLRHQDRPSRFRSIAGRLNNGAAVGPDDASGRRRWANIARFLGWRSAPP